MELFFSGHVPNSPSRTRIGNRMLCVFPSVATSSLLPAVAAASVCCFPAGVLQPWVIIGTALIQSWTGRAGHRLLCTGASWLTRCVRSYVCLGHLPSSLACPACDRAGTPTCAAIMSTSGSAVSSVDGPQQRSRSATIAGPQLSMPGHFWTEALLSERSPELGLRSLFQCSVGDPLR